MESAFRLPFDQYQRYRMVSQIAPLLEGDASPLTMLEVGGWPPRIHRFLPEHSVIIADLETKGEKGCVRAKGSGLPFPDQAFGMSVSLDTIEHVHPDERDLFVAELCRVSRSYVILAAPFFSEAVKAADRAVFEFIRNCAGYEHPYIKEHLDLVLPDLVSTMVGMVDQGLDVQVLPSGRLDRWMLMMAVYYTLDSDPDLKESLPFLMEAYNRSFYEFDKAEPAYRHVLIGSREGLGKRWGKLADLASGESADKAESGGLALTLEFARTLALKQKDREIQALANELSAKDHEIKALNEKIALLEDFENKVKSLPLYSLYDKFIKPKKRP